MNIRRGMKSMVFFLSSLLFGQVWATSGILVITTDTTLAEDHNGNVVIGADAVTLNCGYHVVEGNGSGIGIDVNGRFVVKVQNCTVQNFETGISLSGSNLNIFASNRIRNNKGDGLHLDNSQRETSLCLIVLPRTAMRASI